MLPAWKLWFFTRSPWASQLASLCDAAGIELDEPHAALDQPPRQQAAAAEVARSLLVDAVHVERRLRSPAQISTASGACCCIL